MEFNEPQNHCRQGLLTAFCHIAQYQTFKRKVYSFENFTFGYVLQILLSLYVEGKPLCFLRKKVTRKASTFPKREGMGLGRIEEEDGKKERRKEERKKGRTGTETKIKTKEIHIEE